MSSVFFNKGENCIAAGRLFIEDSIHDQFVQKVVSSVTGPQYWCTVIWAEGGMGQVELVTVHLGTGKLHRELYQVSVFYYYSKKWKPSS